MGYPVSFKCVPGVAKQLAPFILPAAGEGTPLGEYAISQVVRQFTGTPLVVHCDGGYAQKVGVTGFTVTGTDGKVSCVEGRYDVGWSNNACECMAVVHALQCLVS